MGELAASYLQSGDPTGWFDPLYRRAEGHAEAVPWAGLTAHRYVVDWLDDPVAEPPGRRAIVIGCGLGDDAAELARRGFEVVAFDVSERAVDWARQRFGADGIDWQTADLLALPDEWHGAFDLVVEVRTVQSLPGVVRDAAMQAIGSLVAPGGVVLAVTLVATDADTARSWSGPPWAQAPSELAAYRAGGLERVALEHPDPQGEPAMEVRLTLQRPTTGQTPSNDLLGELRQGGSPGASGRPGELPLAP